MKDNTMRHLSWFIVLLLVCACSGRENTTMSDHLVSAQAPVPTGYLLSTQPKMQAMQHWDSLAEKIARDASRAMDHFAPDGTLTVYVAPAGITAFAKSFRESLITHLVGHGVPIAFSPDEAAVLEFTTELIVHRRTLDSNEDGLRPSLEPGFHQARNEKGKYKPLPIVGEESGYFEAPIPKTEIQVNTSLIHKAGFLYRDSSIFYVDAADWQHYQHRTPRGVVDLKRYSVVDK